MITEAEWIRTLPQHPERIQEIKTNGHDCIQYAAVAVVSDADVDIKEEDRNEKQKKDDELYIV